MKCSQCGCTEFTKRSLCFNVDTCCSDGGGVHDANTVIIGSCNTSKDNISYGYKHSTGMPLEAYICTKCGHVELQCSEFIEAPIRAKKAAEELERKKNELKDKLINSLNRLKELKRIIDDENKTVKEVNLAKQEKENLLIETKDLISEAKKINVEVPDELKNIINPSKPSVHPTGNGGWNSNL